MFKEEVTGLLSMTILQKGMRRYRIVRHTLSENKSKVGLKLQFRDLQNFIP